MAVAFIIIIISFCILKNTNMKCASQIKLPYWINVIINLIELSCYILLL